GRAQGGAGAGGGGGAATGGAGEDGCAAAGGRAVRAAGERGRGGVAARHRAGRDSARRGRRAAGLGRPPPLHPRARHRRAAVRHHSILRVSRGPAPDARRRHGRGDGVAARRARCGGRRGRAERGVRPRARPHATLLRPATLFSPASFYRPLLGVFSASAGSLAVLSLVLLLAAGLLWRRGIGRRWWTVGPALLLVLEAPYLVRYLGRGIAPPARGVSLPVWLSWEAALALASMALVLVAAALVRGREEPQRVRCTLPAACGWAALAAVAGLWLWQPYGAWPEWYTFVWLPALLGVIVPAPRRWAVAGIAVVAGTAAALVTW